jgi:hypothetical protein
MLHIPNFAYQQKVDNSNLKTRGHAKLAKIKIKARRLPSPGSIKKNELFGQSTADEFEKSISPGRQTELMILMIGEQAGQEDDIIVNYCNGVKC